MSGAFTSDQAKINYVIGLLRGTALTWVQVSKSDQNFSALSFEEFVGRLTRFSDRPNHAGCASDRLFSVPQGARSVAEYSM